MFRQRLSSRTIFISTLIFLASTSRLYTLSTKARFHSHQLPFQVHRKHISMPQRYHPTP